MTSEKRFPIATVDDLDFVRELDPLLGFWIDWIDEERDAAAVLAAAKISAEDRDD